jgi:hypothetical protein
VTSVANTAFNSEVLGALSTEFPRSTVVREAVDGPLVLFKGAELAARYLEDAPSRESLRTSARGSRPGAAPA